MPLGKHRKYGVTLATLAVTAFLHATVLASEHLADIDCNDQVCAQCHVFSAKWAIPTVESQPLRLTSFVFEGCDSPCQLATSVTRHFYARAPPSQSER